MKAYLLRFLVITFLLPACRPAGDSSPTPSLVLERTGLSTIRLCAPIDSVRSLFPAARDTTYASEGLMWPARIIDLSDGQIRLVASHEDVGRINAVVISSKSVATAEGFTVGMTVEQLIGRGARITPVTGEGILTLLINDGQFVAEVDSATNLWSAQRTATIDPRADEVPPRATITSLMVATRGCP